MSSDLSGKVALVTGASTDGFGAHFARILAQAGAEVIVAARRADKLQPLAEAIGGRAIALDVADAASVKAMAEAAGPIDILVNNAGISRPGATLDLDEADWDATLDTNLKGLWLVSRAIGRGMRERGKGGSIVNIASITAFRQTPNLTAYSVSKAGVIQLTKQMALELARYGVRVNAIAPGYVRTDINRDFFETEKGAELIRRIAQRRLGELDDLTGPLLLLASDASAYMTGSVLTVDGGHLLSTL
ncbi:MAG: glucose 1-dehydrogenase [Sphingomonadales bacterium]|nr:MAG: glucose 1-dehydrogenase [Sphingomonadales bacterium]